MGFLEAVDRSVQTLSRGLEVRARRQAAVAANVANADTPGYRALDVSFAGAFASAAGRMALSTTHGSHFSGLRPSGRDSLVLSGGTPRRDGNDVNIDSEMVKLAQNQVEYQFLARAANGKFRKLKEAISGRSAA